MTLLFTDIEGSTQLARTAGPAWSEVLATHHRLLRDAIEEHGGFVDGSEGDAFFAVFADARAAVRAATAAQRSLAGQRWPAGVVSVRVRMGLHTGLVERREVGYVSLELHRAARVAAAAHGGQILLTEPTRTLVTDEDLSVEDLGDHELKDFARRERLFHVVLDGRGARDFPPPRTAGSRRTNIPAAPGALVGRDDELARVVDLLESGRRLVSLVGAGGAGKTRLALAVARPFADDWPGGAFLVSLAPVTDPRDVLPALARTIGVAADPGDPAPALEARLSGRRSLIVLDNFEQVLDAAGAVADLIARVEDLQVLVTSQAPLAVRGETVVAVDALEPGAAIALFRERARAAAPGRRPEVEEDEAIAEICERVGRLPFAIELAAARVSVLPPAELLRRLGGGPDLLRSPLRDAPDRQRSLRATFEWSHDLLTGAQQALLRRLGVFAGPAPLDAVEAVAGPDGGADDALDALDGLVRFSLVRREDSAEYGSRFTMPEILRTFAREKLETAREAEEVHRRHAEHVLARAAPSRVWFAVSEQVQRELLTIDAEIRPALSWALIHDPPLHRRLVTEIGLGFVRRGFAREVVDLGAAAQSGDGPLDATGAWLSNVRAYALVICDGHEEAERVLAPAIAYVRAAGDPRDLGLLLHTATWMAETQEQERALAFAEESLALLRGTGEPALERRALIALVQSMLDLGRLDEAEATIPVAMELVGRDVMTWRGDIALLRDRPDEAVGHYAVSLERAAREHDELQVINDAHGLAVGLLRAAPIETGMEAAGVATAYAADSGHGGFSRFGGLYGGVDLDQALRNPMARNAFERGRAVEPAERAPHLLRLARAASPVAAPERG